MGLAELRQDEHPNDAVPTYQGEVERAIDAKDRTIVAIERQSNR
jgi:hypothetical protein